MSDKILVTLEKRVRSANGKHSAELGWSEYDNLFVPAWPSSTEIELRKVREPVCYRLVFGNVGIRSLSSDLLCSKHVHLVFQFYDAAALFFLGPSERSG